MTQKGATGPTLSADLGEASDGLLYVRIGEQVRPLPDWAQWLIELGAAHCRSDFASEEKHWAVVTVPDRRFAASLIAHGAICARLNQAEWPSVRDRFAGVGEGTPVTWIDANNKARYGELLEMDDDFISYRPRIHGGWGLKSKRMYEFASSFWPANEDPEFVDGRPLADHPDFVIAATGMSAELVLGTSDIDAILIGNRTQLEADLTDVCFSVADTIGCLADTVRPRGVVSLGQHHRSAIISAVAQPEDVEGSTCHGPAIFDGASGYLRMRDAVESSAAIVVLDRWNPGAENAANTVQIERGETWISAKPVDVGPQPACVELYQWTELR